LQSGGSRVGRSLPAPGERYVSLLKVRIDPALRRIQLRFLEPADVRRWHAALLLTEGVGPSTVAKAYRLVHAVCASAAADEELVRNPCAIPGASAESHDERPVASVTQVYAIADQLGDRWRALVLTATFCGLRFGELAGLTLERVDLLHRTSTVAVDLDELDGGKLQVGRVKSEASRRVVAIPDVIVPELERHLGTHSGKGPTGSFSSVRRAGCYAAATSATCGPGPSPLSVLRIYASTTFATRATRSPPPPERAPAS